MMTEREFLTESRYGTSPGEAFPALLAFLDSRGFHDAARAVNTLEGAVLRWADLARLDAKLDVAFQQPIMDGPAEPESEPKPSNGSVVYFIQAIDGGPIKIGFTRNLTTRLAALQNSHPERLIVVAAFPGGPAEEGELHHTFRAIRLKGEWYAPSSDLLTEIERRRPA